MSSKIQDIATVVFIAAVAILTMVSILGVWEVLDGKVIGKSFSTIGVIGFAAVVTVIAAKLIDKGHTQ